MFELITQPDTNDEGHIEISTHRFFWIDRDFPEDSIHIRTDGVFVTLEEAVKIRDALSAAIMDLKAERFDCRHCTTPKKEDEQ